MQNELKRKTQAIVLAAGNSQRMHSKIPKVMHKIGNLELVNHILQTISALKIQETFIVCKKSLKIEDKFNIKPKIIHQEQNLGTAHAVLCALDYLNKYDLTLILYGDTPFIKRNTIEKMLAKSQECDACLLLFCASDKNAAYGSAIIERNLVKKIVEHKELSDKHKKQGLLSNAGAMLIKTDFLKDYLPLISNKNTQKEYRLTDIVEIASKNGKKVSYCIAKEREAIGINTMQELLTAEYFFQQEMRKDAMKNNVIMLDSKTVYFSYDTVLEGNTIIHQNVIFGEKVKVKNYAEILPFCYICDATIDGAKIGPFTKIIGKTEILQNAQIGSFVEIKNCKIEENSKIKHLSYFGDAYVGKNCNIGAGTITCNFDGKAKHRTLIEKNCFIGANNSLVAPLNIMSNCKTAAGSTITQNVPSNNLAIARSRQVNKTKSS